MQKCERQLFNNDQAKNDDSLQLEIAWQEQRYVVTGVERPTGWTVDQLV